MSERKMTVVAIGSITWACLWIVLGPFLIGKPLEVISPVEYVMMLFGIGIIILLAGSELGWW